MSELANPSSGSYWKNIIPEHYTIYQREGIEGVNDAEALINIILSVAYILGGGVVDYDQLEWYLVGAEICPNPDGLSCTETDCQGICPDYITRIYQQYPEGTLDMSFEEASIRFDVNDDYSIDILDIVTFSGTYLDTSIHEPDSIDPTVPQTWLGGYYYPVLPKLKINGKFMKVNSQTGEGLQNDGINIPFGNRGYDWNEDDKTSPISTFGLGDRFLDKAVIDLNFFEMDEASLEDLSGNNNLGILINDYRINFDEKTKEPTKTQTVNKQKIELTKRKAF